MGLISYFRRKRQEKRELQEKQKYRTFVRDVVKLYERDKSIATIDGKQVHAWEIPHKTDEELRRIVFENAKAKVRVAVR